ncbi:MAG TPA: ComEA family DNA-binding protein [Sporichthyaceae bacterium]|nr:ComEA family DNA-binding protein [Sporichthyaceae bacterium]
MTTDPPHSPGPAQQRATERLRAIGLRGGPRTPEPDRPTVRPRSWRDLDLRAASVVCVVALLAVVLAGAVLWRARPHSVDAGPAAQVVAAPVTAAPREVAPAAPEPTARSQLVVDVEGTVRRPGVVTVPSGSRVRDALSAAGGVLPGSPTTSVNLAEPVSDGEQVVVGGAAPAAAGGHPGSGGPGGQVDLNTATEADLEGLPGIGPVLADRVLDFRRTHGRFTSVDELREVPGIGPAKFAALRSRVRV